MKFFTIFFLGLLFFQYLFGQAEIKNNLTILNLSESFSQAKEVKISRFVNNIKYVPLETSSKTLVTEYARFEVTNDFIIVNNGGNGIYSILLFYRNTGKFLKEIGKQGRGPNEFIVWSSLPFNSYKNEFYAISAKKEIMGYDFSGKIIDKIKIPEWIDPEIPKMTNPNLPGDILQKSLIEVSNVLDSNIFAGFVINSSGWEKKKLVLFSREGIIKIFPNHLTWERDWVNGPVMPAFPPGGFAKFYTWKNNLYFIESFCDTLYRITKDEMVPRFYFNWENFNAPYSKQAEVMTSDHINKYFFITGIFENMNSIFVHMIFKGENLLSFIDKKSNTLFFCQKDNSGISALKDDITGLMDVVPYSITSRNEMVWIIQPGELVKWMKANPEKAASAGKRLPWLKNIDELDNPIIAIGKCKE